MTINRYDLGDVVRVTGAFTDQNGTAIDPSGILFTYRNPAGTSTTLTYGVDDSPVRDGVGNYRVDINASSAGRWFWRWQSTGTGQAAARGEFYVEPSGV